MMNLSISSLPPIFVISLAREVNRRVGITSRLDAAGVSYEIIDAVDGSALDLETLSHRIDFNESRIKYGFELVPGLIGAHLSHYNLWQRIVDDKIDWALILEDDATWEEDFFEIVSGLPKIEWHWELIGLSSGSKKIERVLCDINNKRSLVRHERHARGIGAYAIRYSAAEKLLDHCYVIRSGIDMLMFEYWKNNVSFYMVHPMPAPHLEQDPSTIAYEYLSRSSLSWIERFKGSIQRKSDRWQQSLYCLLHPPRKVSN